MPFGRARLVTVRTDPCLWTICRLRKRRKIGKMPRNAWFLRFDFGAAISRMEGGRPFPDRTLDGERTDSCVRIGRIVRCSAAEVSEAVPGLTGPGW
jgi:hypothetical protein